MKQYKELLQDILDNGVWKEPAREGMPRTKEVFCRTMRFDLSKGFPLLTTKKMFTKVHDYTYNKICKITYEILLKRGKWEENL